MQRPQLFMQEHVPIYFLGFFASKMTPTLTQQKMTSTDKVPTKNHVTRSCFYYIMALKLLGHSSTVGVVFFS